METLEHHDEYLTFNAFVKQMVLNIQDRINTETETELLITQQTTKIKSKRHRKKFYIRRTI